MGRRGPIKAELSHRAKTDPLALARTRPLEFIKLEADTLWPNVCSYFPEEECGNPPAVVEDRYNLVLTTGNLAYYAGENEILVGSFVTYGMKEGALTKAKHDELRLILAEELVHAIQFRLGRITGISIGDSIAWNLVSPAEIQAKTIATQVIGGRPRVVERLREECALLKQENIPHEKERLAISLAEVEGEEPIVPAGSEVEISEIQRRLYASEIKETIRNLERMEAMGIGSYKLFYFDLENTP